MDKLDMESKNIVSDNIKKIKELFPNTIISDAGEEKIDFDKLKIELGSELENKKEKYQLTWPGKNMAISLANTPTIKTLRPIYDKSVNFENTGNVYIEGDNLEVLKILQESYLNKIQCIYIDPPYNTGNDFIYNDDFAKKVIDELIESGQIDEDGNRLVANLENSGRYHSDWLSMIYPRIKLSRNLLTSDGFIMISIDDNEYANLKKVCDEIFGERNIILTTVVNRTSEIASDKTISKHEYLIIYAKDITKCCIKGDKKFTISRGTVGNPDQSMPEIVFPKGIKCYGISDGIYNETRKIPGSSENIENLSPIIVENGMLKEDVTLKAKWRSSNDMRNFFANNMNPTKAKISGEIVEIYFENDRFNPQIKKSTYEKISSLYLDNKRGSKDLENLNLNYFSFPKSVSFLNYLINFSNDDAIVLDFFSGSSTTAHSVLNLNATNNSKRKFIMVQLPEICDKKSSAFMDGFLNICDLAEERIKRASHKIKEDTKANIDYGFRVYKLDSSNMKDVFYRPNEVQQTNLFDMMSNIKEDRTPEDLLTQVILDLGLTLDLPTEEKTINNNKVYYVAENALVACFDDVIDINIIDTICECQPLKVVFKDSSFRTDKDKINLEERVKKASPETKISIL